MNVINAIKVYIHSLQAADEIERLQSVAVGGMLAKNIGDRNLIAEIDALRLERAKLRHALELGRKWLEASVAWEKTGTLGNYEARAAFRAALAELDKPAL